jgi:hypothetical protein
MLQRCHRLFPYLKANVAQSLAAFESRRGRSGPDADETSLKYVPTFPERYRARAPELRAARRRKHHQTAASGSKYAAGRERSGARLTRQPHPPLSAPGAEGSGLPVIASFRPPLVGTPAELGTPAVLLVGLEPPAALPPAASPPAASPLAALPLAALPLPLEPDAPWLLCPPPPPPVLLAPALPPVLVPPPAPGGVAPQESGAALAR